MAATITALDGSTDDTDTARFLVGYSSARRNSGTMYEYLDGTVGGTLRPAMPRSGTLTLLFTGPTSQADSLAAEQLLSRGCLYSLTGATPTSANMAEFMVMPGSQIDRVLDELRKNWTLAVPFQEVTA